MMNGLRFFMTHANSAVRSGELRGKRQELRSKVRGKGETSQVVSRLCMIYNERFTNFMTFTNSAVRGRELRGKVRGKVRGKGANQREERSEF